LFALASRYIYDANTHIAAMVAPHGDELDKLTMLRPSSPFTTGFRHAFRPAAVMIALTACAPRERINSSCEWRDSVRTSLPASSDIRRKHIEEDVRVAQDLGIRYGDSVTGRIYNDAHRAARAYCTDASFLSITRQHGATRAEIDAAVGARIAWPDVPLVFAPTLLLFIAASRIVVRNIAGAYEPEDRLIPIIILCILTPVAALVAVGFTQILAGGVEEIRMRSDHLSFRGAYLSIHVYKYAAAAVAAGVFALIASGYRRHLGTGGSADRRPSGLRR
jgi:hypothetical protein